MARIFTILFLTLEIITGHTLWSQKGWNLTQCIRYSLENNLVLRNAATNVDIRQIMLAQSKLTILPEISGDAYLSESFGRTVDPATNTYSDISNLNNSYGVNASLTLFSGFIQYNRIRFERFNLLTETNRYEQQKNDLAYRVTEAYLGLLHNKGLYALYAENLQLMQKQHSMISKYIAVGRKAESDIFEFDAKLAADSFMLIRQAGNVKKAENELKMLMNLPLSDSMQIDDENGSLNTLPDTLRPETLVETACKHLPDLKITEYKLLAAKKELAMVRGDFAPSISAYAGWNTNYYIKLGDPAMAFGQQLKNNAGEYIGISLRVPLFSRFNKINSVRISKLECAQAQTEHLETVLQFEREINDTYIDWQTADNEYSASTKQLEKSKIAFTTAEKKLALGQINIVEYYIQKNDLLKARTELLRTRLQLALNEKYVQFLLTGMWE